MNARLPRRAVLLPLLLAAGFGLWWVAQAAFATPPTAPPEPRAEASAGALPPTAATAPVPPSAVPREAAAAPVGLAVCVVDPDQRAVPGVTIAVRGEDASFRLPATGSDGIARADRLPGSDVWLSVRHDGCTGSTNWRWSSPLRREVTIRLMRDRLVEVRVTDAQGAPVAEAEASLHSPDGQSAFGQTAHRTGADGIARITIPGTDWLALQPGVRARASANAGRDRGESTVVPFAGAGATRCSIVLTRSPEPTTALVVRFVDDRGAPVAVRGSLHWSVVFSANSKGPFAARAGKVEVAGTESRIVGIEGLDDLELTLHEAERLEARHRVKLPADRQHHETTMQRGEAAPQLEVPLVDAQGAPVTAGEFLLFARHDDGNTSAETKVTPDAQGLVRLVLPATTPGKLEVARPFAADILVWPEQKGVPRPYYTSIGTPPPPPPCLAVRPFPALHDRPTYRVEAVVVASQETTITGRVVDAEGRPAAGVRIGLTSTAPPEPAAFARFTTRSDEGGRFRIRATSLPDEVFVFARRPGGFSVPLRTRPSAGVAIELALQPTGALAMAMRRSPAVANEAKRANSPARIAVVLDESALTDGMWALFRDREWAGSSGLLHRWHHERYLQEDGEVTFDDLVPANYEVRTFFGTTPLLTVRDVLVRAGETTRPPQLDGSVLGDTVEAVWVRVLGPDGKPLADARVRFQLPEWKETYPGGTNEATDAKGEAWFVVPRNAVTDLEVVAQGRAPHRQRGVRFPLEVRLGDGATIAVALRGHEALRNDVRALVISCRPHDNGAPDSPVQRIGDLVQLYHPQARVGDDGRCSIPNLPPGRWRVWLAALPNLGAPRGAGPTFVLLGDHDVASADASRIDLAHELTADELTKLRGR